MKVDLLHGNAVNVALRLGNLLVNRQNVQLHHGGNGQAADNAPDIPHAAVMVMMVVRIFFLTMDGHFHMGSQNAAFFTDFRGKNNTRNTKTVQFLYKSVLIRQQLQQRRGEHIPRRTHRAVKIQRFHKPFSLTFGSIVTE